MLSTLGWRKITSCKWPFMSSHGKFPVEEKESQITQVAGLGFCWQPCTPNVDNLERAAHTGESTAELSDGLTTGRSLKMIPTDWFPECFCVS